MEKFENVFLPTCVDSVSIGLRVQFSIAAYDAIDNETNLAESASDHNLDDTWY